MSWFPLGSGWFRAHDRFYPNEATYIDGAEWGGSAREWFAEREGLSPQAPTLLPLGAASRSRSAGMRRSAPWTRPLKATGTGTTLEGTTSLDGLTDGYRWWIMGHRLLVPTIAFDYYQPLGEVLFALMRKAAQPPRPFRMGMTPHHTA